MAKLNLGDLVKQMSSAAFKVLKDKWPSVKTFAESEFKKIAQTIVTIQKAKLAKEITKDEAKLLMEMQKNATRSVLITAEGLGVLAAEQAINAGLAVVKDAVNKAVGWTLL